MVFHKQSKCLIACRRKFQKLVRYIFFSLKLLLDKDKQNLFTGDEYGCQFQW
ncbi:hypothetical protein Golob_000857 [Gossypium lobatum]|uniref:Uncharacterized protein n=1 Tax=Gossypium lobatum TaxID=34289 RepID=A0A7J8N9G9_9ROSI|nr:hypothetical protein [Gossypium lobatum]